MKTEIKKFEVFNIKINDIDFGDFKTESEWENFKKLINGENQVIIISTDNLSPFMDFLNFKIGDIEYYIVKASPDIIDILNKE